MLSYPLHTMLSQEPCTVPHIYSYNSSMDGAADAKITDKETETQMFSNCRQTWQIPKTHFTRFIFLLASCAYFFTNFNMVAYKYLSNLCTHISVCSADLPQFIQPNTYSPLLLPAQASLSGTRWPHRVDQAFKPLASWLQEAWIAQGNLLQGNC